MRLRSDFITQDIEDTHFLVPVGAESFQGIVRSNRTAAFIVDCLKKETTEAAIVDAMLAKYAVDRETVEPDVREVLDTLRSIGALEE